MIDLQELDYSEFEILVGLLLKREGYSILRGPNYPDTRGPDYETVSPDGRPIFVEVKHPNPKHNSLGKFLLRHLGEDFRASVGKTIVMQFAGDIERYRQQKPNAEGLLIVPWSLSSSEIEAVAQCRNIGIWDSQVLSSKLAKHKDLETLFQATIDAKGSFLSKVQSFLGNTSSLTPKLSASLRSLPCGHDDWREYERLCTEILTYVFAPELAAPDIQSRSDDGLDIIDAIFPIRSNQAPWSLVRSEYKTRFVVAEFKNYCDPIGQAQVESIAQYLWRPAQRFFGMLVSRKNPSHNAIAQRRRKWIEEEKCIIFLTDENLLEMLQLRESQAQPFDVVDAQLEDFFRTLTP